MPIHRVNTFEKRTLKKILNKLPKSDDDLTQFTLRYFFVSLCVIDTMRTHDVSIIN